MKHHPVIQYDGDPSKGVHWNILTQFEIPSQQGAERQIIERVIASIQPLSLTGDQIERLKTAISETTMNAIEHGNHFSPDLKVQITVRSSTDVLSVLVRDQGAGLIQTGSETPDLEAKLAGLQSPRGWGLFLTKNMVDEMRVIDDDSHHTVELIIRLQGRHHE